tara:strand:- start:43852 stop:44838 length:987 start_codon:yes stop_codon:yes gene_type:complete
MSFTKLSDKDFQSRSRFIDTEKKFDAKLHQQTYVALNVANANRQPKSSTPCFRIVGLYESVELATEALAQSRDEGCDGVISETHAPILLSKSADDTSAPEKSQAVIQRRKAKFESQRLHVQDRVDTTRSMSAPNIGHKVDKGTRELEEYDPVVYLADKPNFTRAGVPETKHDSEINLMDYDNLKNSQKNIQKRAIKNLNTKPAVISLIGESEEEPVLFVYAMFDSVEDAKIYTVNTLSSISEFDLSIVATNEWHSTTDFETIRNDLESVEYLDQGLAALMNVAKSSRAKTGELKKYIKEEEIIQPVPDLERPAAEQKSEAVQQLLTSL